MKEIGFIGLGKMGKSILDGMLKAKLYKNEDIILYDHHLDNLLPYKEKGATIANSALEILCKAKYVFLAIKPQSFKGFLLEIKGHDFNPIIVSIAAGITIDYLKSNLGDLKYIRVMPNTPVMIGSGASAIAKGDNVTDEELEVVKRIFNSVGVIGFIDENLMDEVIPVNGSMPAYLYLFAQSFIEEGINEGLSEEVAKKLCCEAIIGSAKMILESNKSIDDLIKDVCSPKGTTLAGLEVLKEKDFKEIIKTAYKACVARSKELKNI